MKTKNFYSLDLVPNRHGRYLCRLKWIYVFHHPAIPDIFAVESTSGQVFDYKTRLYISGWGEACEISDYVSDLDLTERDFKPIIQKFGFQVTGPKKLKEEMTYKNYHAE